MAGGKTIQIVGSFIVTSTSWYQSEGPESLCSTASTRGMDFCSKFCLGKIWHQPLMHFSLQHRDRHYHAVVLDQSYKEWTEWFLSIHGEDLQVAAYESLMIDNSSEFMTTVRLPANAETRANNCWNLWLWTIIIWSSVTRWRPMKAADSRGVSGACSICSHQIQSAHAGVRLWWSFDEH